MSASGQTRPRQPRVRATGVHPITDTNAIRLRDRNGPLAPFFFARHVGIRTFGFDEADTRIHSTRSRIEYHPEAITYTKCKRGGAHADGESPKSRPPPRGQRPSALDCSDSEKSHSSCDHAWDKRSRPEIAHQRYKAAQQERGKGVERGNHG